MAQNNQYDFCNYQSYQNFRKILNQPAPSTATSAANVVPQHYTFCMWCLDTQRQRRDMGLKWGYSMHTENLSLFAAAAHRLKEYVCT